jgi:hypothetical protein
MMSIQISQPTIQLAVGILGDVFAATSDLASLM